MKNTNIVKPLDAFNTDLVIALWEGLNDGKITIDEYYQMLDVQSLDDGSKLDHEMANESNC